MKLRKQLLLMAAGFCCSLSAQTAGWLNVLQKDGTYVSFRLSEQPKSAFKGETMVLSTATRSVEYAIRDVARFTIDDKSGVESIEPVAAGKKAQASVKDNEIFVTGAKPFSAVTIYSISGTVLGTYRTDGQGMLHLNLNHSLNANPVILLNIGDVSYKITTR